MTSSQLTQLEKLFWPSGFKRDVWMIADGARDPRILMLLRECHMEHYCLYSGRLSPALEAAAPYLVQMDYNDRDTRRFLTYAWGNSWGVFLKCGGHAEALRRHLRELLVVRDPNGKHLVFRYYDPRVLRVYLPTCTVEELDAVFGPIDCFWIEDDIGSEAIIAYRPKKKQFAEAEP
jgi:hypothetical protein